MKTKTKPFRKKAFRIYSKNDYLYAGNLLTACSPSPITKPYSYILDWFVMEGTILYVKKRDVGIYVITRLIEFLHYGRKILSEEEETQLLQSYYNDV